jgi:hypothetical protein
MCCLIEIILKLLALPAIAICGGGLLVAGCWLLVVLTTHASHLKPHAITANCLLILITIFYTAR